MKLDGVGVIVRDKEFGYLLHLRDSHAKTMKNQWCLVGGKLRLGEASEACAERELFEETGLRLSCAKLLDSIELEKFKIGVVFGFTELHHKSFRVSEGRGAVFLYRDEIEALLRTLPYSNPYLRCLEMNIGLCDSIR